MNRFLTLSLSVCLSLLAATSGSAQNAMDEAFGIGVHAYFSGNIHHADELFTQLIDAGSEDPRVFYYRGIARVRIGGDGAGQLDFERGADLEMQGKRAVEVGRSLQRIQGKVRLDIEKARSAARLVWSKKKAAERAKLEALAPPRPQPGVVDPFGDDASPLSGRSEKMAAPSIKPEVDAEEVDAGDASPFDDSDSDDDDPFGESSGSKKPSDDDDPFGG